jgi:CheY-like chemotaxis protein
MPADHSTPLARPPSAARVLVVDDDPIFTTMASSCLAASGFETETAGDGAEALELLEIGQFDIALIDLAMPRVDGFRLIGLIRSTPNLARLAILVVSGRRDSNSFEEALALGANAFLTKPLEWLLLPVHIRYALKGASQMAPASFVHPPVDAARRRGM